MNVQIKTTAPFKLRTPCLVLGVFEGKLRTPLLRELDTLLGGALGQAAQDGEFQGKQRQTLLLHGGDRLPPRRILLVGLGREAGAGTERLRQAAAVAAGALAERRITSFATTLGMAPLRRLEMAERVRAVTEGILLESYRFHRFRTEKREDLPPPVEALTLLAQRRSDVAQAQAGATEASAICRGAALARDLVNEPGNVKSPEFLAETAREIAAETGMKCTVMGRPELEREGFGAMLGVAQGSIREPRLITLEYQGSNGDARPIALVGKGVVFDAGGISLKPAEKMDEMKMDMAGGAAVLGTMLGAALLKLPVNLIGVVPAVENLPSGSAIRPGDILTSLSGKTIEVLNTDAEGRLILADALSYVRRFSPRVVIDLATLTGACVIALGHHATAVLGNHEGLAQKLIAAGKRSGERLWQMPLWDDYAAALKSDIADLKNIGGRPGGTITAAAFLKAFAEDLTWAHLDIAGTAWEEKGRPCQPKGGTGVGVRLLLEYLR